MKRILKVFMFLMPVIVACDKLGEDPELKKGELRVAFGDLPPEETRVAMEMPDTNDFLLYVANSEGEVIYEGLYKDAPESVIVKEGSYNVRALSREFSRPEFSSPQYGDEQCVVVPSGGVANVKLTCVQMNAGVLLRIDKSFLSNCPDAALFLKSSAGKLMYGYSEKRIAYFPPGQVSLMMTQKNVDKVLFTRELEPRTILDIEVSAASKPSSPDSPQEENITVAVDTSRQWSHESYVIGQGGSSGKGSTPSDALTVSQALASAGEEDVWVSGYIVGGDLTSASASFEGPFKSETNIILGPRSSSSSRSSCISISLPQGALRDALNLVDNPTNLGKKVCLRGDIVESYYGMVGMKNLTDYEL